MKKRNLLKLLMFVCCLGVLTISMTKKISIAHAEDVVLPESINMSIMKATKANPLGALEVLKKEDVEGATHDVLWYSNKNLKLSDSNYRWSYLNLRFPVTPGEEYKFNMRVKVFIGETTIGTPPTLNSFWTMFSTMSSTVYNAAVNNAFVRIMNDDTIKVNKLGDMCTYFSEDGTTPQANIAAAIAGNWISLSGTFVIPEYSPYNGTNYETTDLVLTLRLESGSDDEAQTRNMYIDTLEIKSAAEPPLELATSSDYWKKGSNEDCFTFDEHGMSLVGNGDVSSAAMLLYSKVKANSTVTYIIDGGLADAAWGNTYIIFKNMDEDPVADTGLVNKGGNYCAFQFGSDNPWIIECIDGEVEKMPASGTADSNDIWYWYREKTIISITTEDTEDGFEATIRFTGKSGLTSTYHYTNFDPRFIGDYATGIEFYTSNEGTVENHITVSSVTISDVFEVELPDIDVEKLNEDVEGFADGINGNNYEDAKELKEAIDGVLGSFNLTMKRAFNHEDYASFCSMISDYELDVEESNAVIALINNLPDAINDSNYEAAKTAIAAARDAYDKLVTSAQGLVNNYEDLQAAEELLEQYEESLIEQQSDSSDPVEEPSSEPSAEPSVEASETQSIVPVESSSEKQSEQSTQPDSSKKKGCKGGLAAGGLISLFAIAGALLLKKNRK